MAGLLSFIGKPGHVSSPAGFSITVFSPRPFFAAWAALPATSVRLPASDRRTENRQLFIKHIGEFGRCDN
jgi:hypothetical protein